MRRLRGPNAYLSRPVLVARLHLDGLAGRDTDAAVAGRLLAALPGLAEHHCAAGRPGGFEARLREGTYFGHVAEHVAIELSQLIGRTVNFGRTAYAGAPGVYDVILESPVDEPPTAGVAEELLRIAIGLVEGVLAGRVPAPDLTAVRTAYERSLTGPSTASIVAAARRRGVPVERVGDLSLLRLGHGCRRRLVWAAMTDRTGGVGVDIAGDKQLTRQLLAEAGVPVPAGGTAKTAEEALAMFAELSGGRVVVKPRGGRQGQHVYLGLSTPEAVRAAFAAASGGGTGDGEVVVERQLGGRDYRVLVVAGQMVAAAERVPAHVVGDGVTDVEGLVARANEDPRRGTGHGRALTRLVVDEVAGALLRRQGHAPGSVPPPGELVWLRDNANLSTGGTSRDVTGEVHHDVAVLCERVAAIIGLDIAGIDLRLPDIGAPLPAVAPGDRPEGGVIEVNAAPGLRMHLEPASGQPRDVGASIVDALYAPGDSGRIPTVAITGTNGKTTTARLAAHLIGGVGLRVGLATTDGVYLDGRMVQRADATGPRSAQVVLGDPGVEAACCGNRPA
jgi:cyanophycin synthetase